MNRMLLSCLLALASVPLAAAETSESSRSFLLAGWVTLSASGQVTQFEPDPQYKLPDALRPAADSLLRATDFEPARIDGEGRASRSWLIASLRLEPRDDSYVVALDSPHVGPRPHRRYFPRFGPPPTRPARFVLSYRVNVEGKVVDAHVEPLDGRLPSGFAKSVVDSTRTWRFDPVEVDGNPLATEVHVPMVVARSGREVEPMVLPPLPRDPSRPGAIGQTAYSPEIRVTATLEVHRSF